MRIARNLGLAALAIVLIGLAVPYIDANGYRQRIEAALERALDRKVTAGKVHFNLFRGPGFTVEDVTIAEDPSVGIEPMASVESLDARVEVTTLWTRQLAFSNLRLNNPSVNLSKSDSGIWNFQLLLKQAAARAAASGSFPSIQVRDGRINFKFGDYKSIFYLTESDLDVDPISADRLDIRFAGQPARTDQASQTFGRLMARGVLTRLPNGDTAIDANVALERSGVSEVARLVEGHPIGVHGLFATNAHVSGPIGNLKVAGRLRLEDIHRWDLLPSKGGGAELNYEGTADLKQQLLELRTSSQQDTQTPLRLRFRASDFLSEPKWAASVEVKDAPLDEFVQAARHLGAPIPDGLQAEGKVAGVIGYSRPGGMQGQFAISDSALRLGDAPALDVRSAAFVIEGNTVKVGPSTVALSDGQSADVEGEYSAESGALSVQIGTRGMNIAEVRTGSGRLFGASAIPVLEASHQGTWRGWVRYTRTPDTAQWSGVFDLHNTRMDVPGLKDPVRLDSATVEVDGSRLVVSRMKGRVGTLPFTGDYRHDATPRPDRLRLDVESAEAGELEQQLLPSLRRESSFLARFRLRNPPLPDWLRTRNLEGRVSIRNLKIGDDTWVLEPADFTWNGASVSLKEIEARNGDALATISATGNLAGTSPSYTLEGKVAGLGYRGGVLTVEGKSTTSGTGSDLLANAKSAGTFSADEVTLSPEFSFQSISGTYDLTPGWHLKLTGIQATQGLDAYTGQGTTQPDGRLLLDLTTGKRQVRVAVAK